MAGFISEEAGGAAAGQPFQAGGDLRGIAGLDDLGRFGVKEAAAGRASSSSTNGGSACHRPIARPFRWTGETRRFAAPSDLFEDRRRSVEHPHHGTDETAACRFVEGLRDKALLDAQTERVEADLYGSPALTGKGHAT